MVSLVYSLQHMMGTSRPGDTALIATSSWNRKTKAYLVQLWGGSLFGVGWLVHFLEAVEEVLPRDEKPSIIDYFLPELHNIL